MPLKKRKVVFFAFEMQNEENEGSGSRMRVGPASLTFVHFYSEIWESNLTSPSCTPSNQTVFKPQDELGHYERACPLEVKEAMHSLLCSLQEGT